MSQQSVILEIKILIISFNIFSFRVDDEGFTRKLNRWEQSIVNISRWFVCKYTFLHQIEKIYVNVITREITVKANGRHEPILSKNFSMNLMGNRRAKTFYKWLKVLALDRKALVDESDFEKIQEILNNRED